MGQDGTCQDINIKILGTYSFGDADDELIQILVERGELRIKRSGRVGRRLGRNGKLEFAIGHIQDHGIVDGKAARTPQQVLGKHAELEAVQRVSAGFTMAGVMGGGWPE